MAFLNHDDKSTAVRTPEEILNTAADYGIQKLAVLGKNQVKALMEEMTELNVLQSTAEGKYRFSRYSFFQMMGTVQEIDEKLNDYMV